MRGIESKKRNEVKGKEIDIEERKEEIEKEDYRDVR